MKQTLTFLSQLAKNNNKDWFDLNREEYQKVKKNVIQTVENIIEELAKFDPEISNQNASACLFRINKDIRFSKDKSPYKLNFGASISPGGRKSTIPGYYLQIQPKASFLAVGTYQPLPDQLYSIRQEIDYNFDEFKKIVSEKIFKKNFGKLFEEDALKNAPKGFDKDSPSLEFIRNRHFIAVHSFSDKDLLSKDFIKRSTEIFKSGIVFNKFLRRSME